jgi:hypothetical protein
MAQRVEGVEGGHWETMAVRSNFMDMAESSTGGGGGISRPYGTFVAARRGDGCALWQRVPNHQLPTHSKQRGGAHGSPARAMPIRRYDFFPGSTMAASRVDLAVGACVQKGYREFLRRKQATGRGIKNATTFSDAI